jgi:predicted short-subunit dehydrogenase-like oxidoreductase (DUF2520 family)
MKKIVIIGAGNLGFHLALKLGENELLKNNLFIFNRKENEITQFLKNEKFNVNIGWEQFIPSADIYILTVKDSAIKEVSENVIGKINQPSLIIHTSGSIESRVLEKFENFGVIYPLYSFSFSEKKINWSEIPVFIIGNNVFSTQTILSLSQNLNPKKIISIDDEQKLHLHLLAVMANNFTNGLSYAIYKLANENNFYTELYSDLLNFAQKTIQRSQHNNPVIFQTGPAKRKDEVTIEKHLKLLEHYPEIQKLYKAFTEYIQTSMIDESNKK